MIQRVWDALCDAGLEPRLITHHPEWFPAMDLPSRPDTIPGAGPLGGIHATLAWVAEEGRQGALCVPCDAPFLPPALLRALVQHASNDSAVVPESGGRRGMEPLCAYYPVSFLPQIEGHLALGRYRLMDLLEVVPVRRIPLAEVRRWGEPEHTFLNVNTPEDHQRAEALARA